MNVSNFFKGAAKAGFGTVVGIFRQNQLARMISSFEETNFKRLRKGSQESLEERGLKCFDESPINSFLADQWVYLSGMAEAKKFGFLVVDLTFKQAMKTCEAVSETLHKMHMWSNKTGLDEDTKDMKWPCRVEKRHTTRSHKNQGLHGRIGLSAADKIKYKTIFLPLVTSLCCYIACASRS